MSYLELAKTSKNLVSTNRNLSFVCAAMSRTENWREPPFTSLACAGSHVGRWAVDMLEDEVSWQDRLCSKRKDIRST